MISESNSELIHKTLHWLSKSNTNNNAKENSNKANNNNSMLAYVALSDHVHHQFYPGTQEANKYYNLIDGFIEQVDKMNGIIAVTSPNGINDKIDFEDNPKIIDIEGFLKTEFGIDHVKLAVSRFLYVFIIYYIYMCVCVRVDVCIFIFIGPCIFIC